MRHRKESLEETGASKHPQWSFGMGLYPLQALVHPIELRFRYHFMGTKGTNRIDKVIPSHYSFSNKFSLRYSQNGLLPIFLTRCTFTRHSLPLTFKHSRLRPGTLQYLSSPSLPFSSSLSSFHFYGLVYLTFWITRPCWRILYIRLLCLMKLLGVEGLI